MRSALFVLILTSVAFAGCVGGFTATAMDLKDAADDRAREWDVSARLVSVAGFETRGLDALLKDAADSAQQDAPAPASRPSAHASAPSSTRPALDGFVDAFVPAASSASESPTPDDNAAAQREEAWMREIASMSDSNVGDGKAPGWIFVYAGTGKTDALGVVVGADGSVRHAEAFHVGDTSEAEAIAGWTIDSDAAVRVVSENSATVAAALEGDSANLLEGLMMEDGKALWMVMLIDPRNNLFEGFFVNARDGTFIGDLRSVMPKEVRPSVGRVAVDVPGSPSVPPEEGRFDEQLTAFMPEQTHAFVLEFDGHPALAVKLDPGLQVATDLSITLVGPGGAQSSASSATLSPGPDPLGRAPIHLLLDNPAAGEWTALVSMGQGAFADYTLSYCAAGLRVRGSAVDVEPCEDEDWD